MILSWRMRLRNQIKDLRAFTSPKVLLINEYFPPRSPRDRGERGALPEKIDELFFEYFFKLQMVNIIPPEIGGMGGLYFFRSPDTFTLSQNKKNKKFMKKQFVGRFYVNFFVISYLFVNHPMITGLIDLRGIFDTLECS